MKYSIVIPLTIMLLASCTQKKLPISQIELYVRYEAETQKILAEASFSSLNDKGNIVPLNLQGGVAFLSSNMEKKELPLGKIRFSYEHKGELPETLTLSWNNAKGSKISMTLDAVKIGDFKFLSENDSYILSFDSPPLTKEESLVLLFTDANQKMLNKQFDGQINGNSILLNNNDLAELSTGKGFLSLVRIKKYTEKGGDYECNTTYSFYSKPIIINL